MLLESMFGGANVEEDGIVERMKVSMVKILSEACHPRLNISISHLSVSGFEISVACGRAVVVGMSLWNVTAKMWGSWHPIISECDLRGSVVAPIIKVTAIKPLCNRLRVHVGSSRFADCIDRPQRDLQGWRRSPQYRILVYGLVVES